MIPDHVVEEVRSRADLVEVVGEHVPLKRAGREFRALCPFHREKTPSFYVVPEKGFYKCFGCGEAGDVFTFLMKHQGMDFLEAVRHLAGRLGVDIPDSREERREDERHRELYEAVGFALDFYRERLRDEASGAPARRYLDGRGVTAASIDRFQLGYAPPGWRSLRDAAHRHGIEDAVLLEAGLIKTSERSDEPYDRLRDRLVFPILDVRGRAIGFGGRVLDGGSDGAPKYLNSPETPIYHKGRVLYGLHWARTAIRREEFALIVEGYMDYVALAANGIENAVAPLGTSLTPEQAGLLARYTGRALLLFDSDQAGLRATFRSGDVLLRAGVHPLVVTLPPGEDPDSVVRSGGAEALSAYLDAAVDVLDRKLQILELRGYLDGIDGRRKALDGLLPTLRAAADPALRDIYVARIAERTGVRPETLERELGDDRGGESGAWSPAGAAAARPRGGARATRGGLASGAGGPRGAGPGIRPRGAAGPRGLLLLMLRDESRIPQAAELVRAEEIDDDAYRELFRALVELGRCPADGAPELKLGPVARLRYEELSADPEELSDTDRMFADTVKDIRFEQLCRRLDELDARLAAARARGAEAEQSELVRRKAELNRELAGLGRQPLERFSRLIVRQERQSGE